MIVSIKGVSKKFANIEALKNINLNIYKGDCLGLIGPNGAGKTTLIMIILGIINPTKGKVLKLINNNKDNTEINKLLKLTNLWERKNEQVKNYSKGMKQRLSIARSLLNNPNLLIIDEPLNSLDPKSHKLIINLIQNLNKDNKVTIFITSHNLYDLEKICSKIAIIKKGEIIKYDTINNLTKNNKKTYLISFENENNINIIDSTISSSKINANHYWDNDKLVIELNKNMSLNNVLNIFIQKKINIKECRKYDSSLEDVYIKHINERRKN